MDVRGESGEGLEENPVAKRKDSISLFGGNRDAAVIAASGYVPAVGHLLQHSRRSDWWCVLLGDNEDKKTSVKRDETVIYWEQQLPTLLE